ncbi:hypothetical protein K474DRAFT_1594191 [Panus rudis PR-1116 ss-1]|nr:hypothetical protein K474DRAFT_1594191 [Panus rudis PR-1116 ss-1]
MIRGGSIWLDLAGRGFHWGWWAVGSPHSTATLSIQGGPAVCTGFGSCTVSIFSCPASAFGLGRPFFFWLVKGANPNLRRWDKGVMGLLEWS